MYSVTHRMPHNMCSTPLPKNIHNYQNIKLKEIIRLLKVFNLPTVGMLDL